MAAPLTPAEAKKRAQAIIARANTQMLRQKTAEEIVVGKLMIAAAEDDVQISRGLLTRLRGMRESDQKRFAKLITRLQATQDGRAERLYQKAALAGSEALTPRELIELGRKEALDREAGGAADPLSPSD
jgi:hypothetical protein